MIMIMTIIIDHGDQEKTTKPPTTSSPPTYATQQAPFHGHPIIAQSMVCRSNTSTNRHHIMPGDRSIDRSIDDMEWRTMGWAVGGECVRGGNHTASLACACTHVCMRVCACVCAVHVREPDCVCLRFVVHAVGSRQAGQTYSLKKQHSHCDDDPESSDHDDDDDDDPHNHNNDPEPRQRP